MGKRRQTCPAGDGQRTKCWCRAYAHGLEALGMVRSAACPLLAVAVLKLLLGDRQMGKRNADLSGRRRPAD
jgi:hypothetical protein